MSRHERTGTRDLTFSAWHRNLHDETGDYSDCPYIDIDYCGYCNTCQNILVLMEIRQSFSIDDLMDDVQKKCASITKRLANGIIFTKEINLAGRSIIPSYVMAYYSKNPISATNIKPVIDAAAILQLTPVNKSIGVINEKQLRKFIRDIHECEFCKKYNQGKYALS